MFSCRFAAISDHLFPRTSLKGCFCRFIAACLLKLWLHCSSNGYISCTDCLRKFFSKSIRYRPVYGAFPNLISFNTTFFLFPSILFVFFRYDCPINLGITWSLFEIPTCPWIIYISLNVFLTLFKITKLDFFLWCFFW